MSISWPTDAGGNRVGIILRQSNWNNPSGIIADQTRSGGFVTRENHIKTPRRLNITMRFTYDEYVIFEAWYENTAKRGLHHFLYPKVNVKSGALTEYAFDASSDLDESNPAGDDMDIKMVWLEV